MEGSAKRGRVEHCGLHGVAAFDAKSLHHTAVRGRSARESHIEGKLVHRDGLIPGVEDERLGAEQQRPFHPDSAYSGQLIPVVLTVVQYVEPRCLNN